MQNPPPRLPSLLPRVTMVWLGLFALAFLNGALREGVLSKLVAEPWAHHLSVLTCLLFFTVYTATVWGRVGIRTYQAAAFVGTYWFGLTLITETFLIGRLMSHASWADILTAYDLRRSLWPLVLAWVAALPIAMVWATGRRHR